MNGVRTGWPRRLAVAVSSVNGAVYVTDTAMNTMSVISARTNEVTATIPVGSGTVSVLSGLSFP
jgi:YVTN family beta-propeller protein